MSLAASLPLKRQRASLDSSRSSKSKLEDLSGSPVPMEGVAGPGGALARAPLAKQGCAGWASMRVCDVRFCRIMAQ